MVTVRILQRLARVRPQTLVRQLRVLQDSLGGNEYTDYDLSFSLTTAAHLRRLNRQHTGEDASTDVLSFAIEHDVVNDPSFPLTRELLLSTPYLNASGVLVPPSAEQLPCDLGEIFVSTDHVMAHAGLKQFSCMDYLLAVATHGVAHLVGYRHDTVKEWAVMREAEIIALDTLYNTRSAWCDIHPSPMETARNMPVSYLSQTEPS